MYRQIHTSIWAEPWFEPLSKDAKLLFLYLCLSDETQPCGAWHGSYRRITFETGLSTGDVEKALTELSSKVSQFHDDGGEVVLWIHKFAHWQDKGGNWQRAVIKSLEHQPEDLRAAFQSEYRIHTPPTGIDTHPTRMDTQATGMPDDGLQQDIKTQTEAKAGIPVDTQATGMDTHSTVSVSVSESVHSSSSSKQRASTAAAENQDKDNDNDPEVDIILKALCKGHEDMGVMLTHTLGEELQTYALEYKGPVDWIADAFKEAVNANARSWRYVRAILDRWQTEGKQPRAQPHKQRLPVGL